MKKKGKKGGRMTVEKAGLKFETIISIKTRGND